MASCEQGTIEQASLCETPAPDASRDATETTPLVTINDGNKKSVLIKSKAAIMILCWTVLMSLIYGSFLNPEVYLFVFVTPQFGLDSIEIIVATCTYAATAFWLLFYPLAGYCADIRYGRYKVVRCGVFTTWCGLLTVTVIGGIVNAIAWPLILSSGNDAFYTALWAFFGLAMGVLGFFLLISIWIAFAGFLANVIQFGVDQLPSRDSFLFIHWFLFTLYIGISLGKLVWSAAYASGLISLFLFGVVLLVVLVCVPVTFCVAKRRWFVTDTGTSNPYKEVARVVGFARRNKIPIQRNAAFTVLEDDIPTGLDLGKDKYGGPFTTEQVENVKSFFGIVVILLSIGSFFTADIAAAPFLSILRNHMEAEDPFYMPDNRVKYIFYSVFTNGGTLYPVFIVVFVPIFLKFIHPLFQKYSPGILRRIGIGLCLITVSLFCSLFVDTVGHLLPSGHNAGSVFGPQVNFNYTTNNETLIDQTLHLSPYILIIQQVLVAVAYVFIYGGVFEFICAQSPHSMKGFLIGILFAVKGLFQLIGVLGVLLPFSFWQTSPRAGLVYFLVNILISVAGVVVFIIAAKRYQYRQRDELCNVRKYIEEVYEKDVNHAQS
ncbi:uncharacterized protein LOC135333826 [Halichondria panicea]|uniref:uncharacterized protein LOC135333826 n=1 Tax=Halichondria panicea TaxID=6063 RepID=UPI00312B7FC6